MVRVAEQHLRTLRTFEPQVRVVIPREADASVDLNGIGRGAHVRIRRGGFRHRREPRRLFVARRFGRVQALDARTGCVYWTFEAQGPVRAAMTVAADGTRSVLLFSDQNGGVYAVDARSGVDVTTGQERWFYEHWMSGAAGHFLRDESVSGLIAVMALNVVAMKPVSNNVKPSSSRCAGSSR